MKKSKVIKLPFSNTGNNKSLSIEAFDNWKQLQYTNEVRLEAYYEQKLLDEECNNKTPIYESRLWDKWDDTNIEEEQLGEM